MEAVADAVDEAARHVCQLYKQKTVDVANELSKYYDEITNHGSSKMPIKSAVNKAYEKYNQRLLKGAP